jgi:hypothetical protein
MGNITKQEVCKTCKFWTKRDGELNLNFGKCIHPGTHSWVRGQSFEPPDYFGCINWFGNNKLFIEPSDEKVQSVTE